MDLQLFRLIEYWRKSVIVEMNIMRFKMLFWFFIQSRGLWRLSDKWKFDLS